MKHIVALSGGKDSTAMALRLAEVEPQDYEYVITPTGDELPEMYAHWRKLEGLLGKAMTIINKRSLKGVIKIHQALPNWRMRFCTTDIKIIPFNEYLLRMWPCTAYVGMRADEPFEKRKGNRVHGGIEQRFPLREWGWTISDVLDYLEFRGVTIPPRTDCARCFFQTIAEWKRLYEEHPEIYADAIAEEESTGHTYRSPGRDTWPASLKELASEFDRGRMPRTKPSMEGRPTMCSTCAR